MCDVIMRRHKMATIVRTVAIGSAPVGRECWEIVARGVIFINEMAGYN